VRSRNLPDYCIRHTQQGSATGAGGRDQFGSYLLGLPSIRGFYDLTDIILVADCDDKPDESFKYICDQISNAKPQATPLVTFTAPKIPNVPRAKDASLARGEPYISILMLPWAGEVGCLETLCLKSAADAAPAVAVCMEEYAQCVSVDQWPVSKQAKMKLQALMAGAFKDNPAIALGRVWTENPKETLVPLKHPCFDRLETFLKSF
jgi:hypothetical protein